MTQKNKNWYNNGKKHIWHPYTQHKTAPEPIKVKATTGCEIILENGSKLIDGTSSWWTACWGYNHPHIIKAIEEQLTKLPHFMFAGAAHEGAYILAQRLANLTGLDRIFFTDSGSTAIETALKISVQYWKNKGDKRRNKFISFKHGYHGDTMGCMSLCDPEKGMHKTFNEYMPKQYCVRLPVDEYDFFEFENMVEGIGNTTAAIIIEPLVQGAAGMQMAGAEEVLAEPVICLLVTRHLLLLI